MLASLLIVMYGIALITIQVRRFAVDVVAPRVRDMDEKEAMAPEIIKGLFGQGVCIQTQLLLGYIHYLWAAHGYRNGY